MSAKATDRVCAVDVSRSPQGVRSIGIRTDGLLPTLTTRNYNLWVERDRSQCDDHSKPFYGRYITIEERFKAMGLPVHLIGLLPGKMASLKAVGNSMQYNSTLVILACLVQGMQ